MREQSDIYTTINGIKIWIKVICCSSICRAMNPMSERKEVLRRLMREGQKGQRFF